MTESGVYIHARTQYSHELNRTMNSISSRTFTYSMTSQTRCRHERNVSSKKQTRPFPVGHHMNRCNIRTNAMSNAKFSRTQHHCEHNIITNKSKENTRPLPGGHHTKRCDFSSCRYSSCPICRCVCVYVCMCVCVCVCEREREREGECVSALPAYVDMGWLMLVGSIKLHISFAKETYKRDNILQKRPII